MNMTTKQMKEASPRNAAITYWRVANNPIEELDYHPTIYDAVRNEQGLMVPSGFRVFIVYGGTKSYKPARWV